jgi:putative endopeptidase
VLSFTALAQQVGQPTLKPGFDVNSIDRSANPCSDFYQYSCGNWIAANPVPPDQAAWSRFNVLAERNRAVLKDILETSMAKKNIPSGEQKIADYYAACMDEKDIDEKGTAPLEPELKRISAIAEKGALIEEAIRLQRIGANVMFHFGSTQDFKNSSEVIGDLDQGGLGLPERDYYFKDDPKAVETRKKYVMHLQKVFELLGSSSEKAELQAKAVMAIETSLAKGALDRVSRRDPAKTYHRMDVKQVAQLTPSVDWNKYFVSMGAPKIENLNVSVPDFMKQLESTIQTTSLDDWKSYLAVHYVRVSADFLPAAFVNENFDFYGRTLTGAKELRVRWKRCVQATDSDLPELLGRKYVELTFGKEGKDRTLRMVHEIESAMEKDIQALDWMTPATKQRALDKLRLVTNKIGYPEKWKTYDGLAIRRDDPLGNGLRANEWQFKERLAKIGKPVDMTEWYMSPPTVNAYYNPLQNNINFPAGILQPPFYDNQLDDAVNYGGIGAVVGHELTHGFDDQGRQFDGKGNLSDWWTEQDAKEFKERAGCIDKEYSGFTAVGDLKVNGKLTLGENAADNGGLRLAYMALMEDLAGKTVAKIDGYTPQQRFFLGWGQIWCSNQTPESTRLRTLTDPHSPGRYRVNGTVSNMPEFQRAFSCSAGQPMVRENACRVW